MSTLRHAREAKRLLRRRFAADPRVLGVGLARDDEGGFAVEVRLGRPLEETPPETQRTELDDGTAEVPVRWRVTGRIDPHTGEG